MRKQLIPVWVVMVVTLGSGLVNLFSVIGPGMPERGMWLLRILVGFSLLDLPRLGIALRRITGTQEQGFDAEFLRTCYGGYEWIGKAVQ